MLPSIMKGPLQRILSLLLLTLLLQSLLLFAFVNAISLREQLQIKHTKWTSTDSSDRVQNFLRKLDLENDKFNEDHHQEPLPDWNGNTKSEDDIKNINNSVFLGFSTFHRRFLHSSKILNVLKTNSTNIQSNVNTEQRSKREDISNPCYKFEEGDPMKKEFYSPNYPNPYPKNISCYKVLEADPGMVLKVEFRDNFELEDHEKCSYDYLEVRDGKYGYSRPIGNYCRAFPFPEITSSSKYLWLHFHSDSSIQGTGFRAVWNMISRPQVKTPETEECILNVTNLFEHEIKTSEIEDKKQDAIKRGTELDCIWNITVPEGWKIQMTFPKFELDKPNECDINYVQVYDKEPTKKNHPSLINNFCGSIADLVTSKGNEAYLRFFVTKAAMKSNFEAIMTAIREKGKDKECKEDEFDCQDACIAGELKCNDRPNCRYRFDEDSDICHTEKSGLNMASEHIIIVLIVFTFIMTGLCCTCIINCIRKLMRDQKIIKEHLRQSRENRLDELGRNTTSCLIVGDGAKENGVEVNGTTESLQHHHHIHQHCSESPSFEILASTKELVPSVAILSGQERSVRLSDDLNDIHQSNNVSNASQERAQQEWNENYDEHETREMACQTRESIFESTGFMLTSVANPAEAVQSFGNKSPEMSFKQLDNISQLHHSADPQVNPQSFTDHHRHHHMNRQVTDSSSSQPPSPPFIQQKQPSFFLEKKCSICVKNLVDPESMPLWLCERHSSTPLIVPAPPGWSAHESMYSFEELTNLHLLQSRMENQEANVISISRNASGKDTDSSNTCRLPSKFMIRQRTVGSGENYGFIYGLDDSEKQQYNFEASKISEDVFEGFSGAMEQVKCPQISSLDSRFKTEAVIEIDQKRPFSFGSTKSAPDVIATH